MKKKEDKSKTKKYIIKNNKKRLIYVKAFYVTFVKGTFCHYVR